jgi:hypothetical protein
LCTRDPRFDHLPQIARAVRIFLLSRIRGAIPSARVRSRESPCH